jgi:Tn3 transposase DDE domain
MGLTQSITEVHRQRLDQLLRLRDTTQTSLVWLRNFPRRPTPQSVLTAIERIEYIDGLSLPPLTSSLYANRITRLAREGMRHTPQYIERLDPMRRYGLLVAIISELRKDLIDHLILLHDRMMGQFFSRSERQLKDAFHQRGKQINDKVRLYAKIGTALIRAKDANTDWQKALASVISWDNFRVSVAEAEALAMGENFDFLDHLKSRYSYLRQYVPKLLSLLPIHATAPAQSLLAAVELLRELNASGKRAIPQSAPTEFIRERWEAYVFAGQGIDRQYYELHVLSELRSHFRSGDMWIEGSRNHRELDAYLLSQEDWARRKTNGEEGLVVADWHAYSTGRQALLSKRLIEISRKIARGSLPEVTLTNDVLHIGQPEKTVPDEAIRLAHQAYSVIPQIKLTDLLVEVDGWTHFSDYFTRDDDHTQGVKEKAILFAAILADATNLGLRKMAQVTPGITLSQLAWVSDYYIREDTYQKALTRLWPFRNRPSADQARAGRHRPEIR